MSSPDGRADRRDPHKLEQRDPDRPDRRNSRHASRGRRSSDRYILNIDTHDQPFVTIGQVAHRWQCHWRTVRKLIREEVLPAAKLPGGVGWRIALQDLRECEAKSFKVPHQD